MAKRTRKKRARKEANPDKPEAVQRAEAALAKALEEADNKPQELERPATPTPQELEQVKRKHLQRALKRATKSAQGLNRMLKALAKSIEE